MYSVSSVPPFSDISVKTRFVKVRAKIRRRALNIRLCGARRFKLQLRAVSALSRYADAVAALNGNKGLAALQLSVVFGVGESVSSVTVFERAVYADGVFFVAAAERLGVFHLYQNIFFILSYHLSSFISAASLKSLSKSFG